MNPTRFPQLYLTQLRSLNRADRTIRWYRVLLDRFERFAHAAGLVEWTEVTAALLAQYRQHLVFTNSRSGRPLTVAVRNLHLIVLRGLFGYLHEIGQMDHNPAAGLVLAREPRRLPRSIPSISDMHRLLGLPDLTTNLGIRDRTIMEVFYGTGIRLAELIHLKQADLDMDEGMLVVRQGKGRKDRAVPLGKVAHYCLKVYLRRIRPQLCQDPEEPHVFLSYRGYRISARAMEDRLQWYGRQMTPSMHLTPHGFRHAFATHLMQHHANVRHVQEMLGHAKLETTERYVHITIMDLKKAHRRFHPRENRKLLQGR